MSAPAIALIVISSLVYLVVGIQFAGVVGFLFADSGLFGREWPVGCLALLAIPLWPLIAVVGILIGLVGSLFP